MQQGAENGMKRRIDLGTGGRKTTQWEIGQIKEMRKTGAGGGWSGGFWV